MARELQKRPVPDGAVLAAYRIVATNDRDPNALAPSFYSNKRRGRQPRFREIEHEDIWDSLSMFMSLQGALDLRSAIARRTARSGTVLIGDHVAALRLEGGSGVQYEDLRRSDGHISVWAPPLQLVACVVDIYPATDVPNDR